MKRPSAKRLPKGDSESACLLLDEDSTPSQFNKLVNESLLRFLLCTTDLPAHSLLSLGDRPLPS
jgi:hypothetical protein